jgi:hypothetical protein
VAPRVGHGPYLEDQTSTKLRGNTLLQRIAHLVELTPQAVPGFDEVDEASMVDLATAYALARRLFQGARLLLEQEDGARLPAVGFGLVLRRLVDNPQPDKVRTRPSGGEPLARTWASTRPRCRLLKYGSSDSASRPVGGVVACSSFPSPATILCRRTGTSREEGSRPRP